MGKIIFQSNSIKIKIKNPEDYDLLIILPAHIGIRLDIFFLIPIRIHAQSDH